MMHTDFAKINLDFVISIPSLEFMKKAWIGEPLTSILTNTNITYALPPPCKDFSLIAHYENKEVGQCSTNRSLDYWTHVEKIDPKDQNLSTQIFVKIHRKAVEQEKLFLKSIAESVDQSYHNAGIAVLPSYRGFNIGLLMCAQQIDLCHQLGITTLFCETTNRFSARIVEKVGFIKIAEYPYAQLAEEFNYHDLKKIEDNFTVWCLKIKNNVI